MNISENQTRLDQCLKSLEEYNSWRRGDTKLSQPDPTEIGSQIDVAIEFLNAIKSGIYVYNNKPKVKTLHAYFPPFKDIK